MMCFEMREKVALVMVICDDTPCILGVSDLWLL